MMVVGRNEIFVRKAFKIGIFLGPITYGFSLGLLFRRCYVGQGRFVGPQCFYINNNDKANKTSIVASLEI